MTHRYRNSPPLVSIIIRTRNEERWIGCCLEAVYRQRYENFEVILVDNRSTDQTVAKAEKYPVKVIYIDDFLPGKAINLGIRASSGEVIAILSGHCIPVDENWLGNLVADLEDEQVAGVYGRQEPLSFTPALDKRDLAIIFGLDRKIQIKDSFFHNANSALRRSTWERFPFDETVTNVEDRVWGTQVIGAGLKIVYEPTASVYHYHGIHQGRNIERAERVVQILDNLQGNRQQYAELPHNDAVIAAIIPIRGKALQADGVYALQYTIGYLRSCHLVKHIVVSTDNRETAEIAKSLGADTPFLRPESLSKEYVDLPNVLAYSLQRVEESIGIVDLVVIAEETHPFRPPGMLEAMIRETVNGGNDTTVAAYRESRRLWQSDADGIRQIGESSFMPRSLRQTQVHIGLLGLCCVTHPTFVRDRSVFGPHLGLHPVDHPLSTVEIRDERTLRDCIPLLENWHHE